MEIDWSSFGYDIKQDTGYEECELDYIWDKYCTYSKTINILSDR
jgi:hypothetical protein